MKKWSLEELKLEAFKYSNRTEFAKNSSAYQVAQRKGILDIICKHMILLHKKTYDKEYIFREAKKYDTLSKFAKANKSVYNAAQRMDLLGEIGKFMNTDYWKWSYLELKKEASKYKTRSEFKRKSSAYQVALNRGVLDSICSHMKLLWFKKWDYDSLVLEASKYKTKKDFYENSKGAYLAAQRMGILKTITGDMLSLRRENWTEVQIVLEASKYNCRSNFMRLSPGAYGAARRLKLLEKSCAHMVPKANLYRRMLYAFEHSDNTVYVGLSYDPKQRYAQHMNNNKILINKKKVTDQQFIIFSQKYTPKEASKAEIELVEKYKKEGWIILNKAKAGALGHSRIFWTKEKVMEEAYKYKRKVDFEKGSRGAYKAALRYGIEQFCNHMVKSYKNGRPVNE